MKHMKGGKFEYNEWIICLPCGFAYHKITNERIRFGSVKNEQDLVDKITA